MINPVNQNDIENRENYNKRFLKLQVLTCGQSQGYPCLWDGKQGVYKQEDIENLTPDEAKQLLLMFLDNHRKQS